MATAADVPGKFDVVINGTGYLFYDQIDESLPFRTAKAIYSYSPTFVERQNTQGNFGDNQQDFWLTASQNDWTQGEEQRFFRANDVDSRRGYYRGTNVDVTTVKGQVSMRQAVKTLTFAAAARCVCPGVTANTLLVGSTTNLYEVAFDGTITDRGAHGLGASPAKDGIAFDGSSAFVSSTVGGTVGVRRLSNLLAYSTFSATPADSLAYLNNTLYGWRSDTDVFSRYDTAGVATTLFSFRDAIGGSIAQGTCKLASFGNKLAIVRSSPRGGVWIYDGTGVSLLAQFEADYLVYDVVESNGLLFISGARRTNVAGNVTYRPTVLFYANGNIGKLWESSTTTLGALPTITAWNGSVVWTDDVTFQFLYWEPGEGSVQRIGSYGGAVTPRMAAGTTHFLMVGGGVGTSGALHPDTSTVATTSTITSSLFDFDSSLDKLFRGFKVDFDSASDGNGGTVDIAYRVGDPDGSFTTLQTGATSGTEYLLSGVSGRNISVKVTLNKGTSTRGPVLKRVYVRAAPVLQQFPIRQYTIAAFGDPAEQTQILRDGTTNTKSGRDLANSLITAVSSTSPISITDRFGTYTAVLEPADFELHEIHANPQVPATKSGSFVAKVTARGV